MIEEIEENEGLNESSNPFEFFPSDSDHNFEEKSEEKEQFEDEIDLNEEELIINDNEEYIEQRSWIQRTFGRMEPGSLRGSIFTLSILSLGIGSLAIPQKIGKMGLILSPILIILSGFANLWSLKILGRMSLKYNLKKYEHVIKHLFGNGMSLFVGIIMIINQTGVIILFQVILYKILGGIINEIENFGSSSIEDYEENKVWNKYRIRILISFGIAIFILFPLCQLKDVSKMRYGSTFCMISLFILILIIVIECPFFIKENIIKKKQTVNYYDILPGLKGNMELLQSIITLFFSYGCHVGAFAVFESLYRPTRKRVRKLLNRVITIDIFCYLIIGGAGYLTQPEKTPDLIIERKKIFKRDWLMSLGNLFFMFALIAKICVNYKIQKSSILIHFIVKIKINIFFNN